MLYTFSDLPLHAIHPAHHTLHDTTTSIRSLQLRTLRHDPKARWDWTHEASLPMQAKHFWSVLPSYTRAYPVLKPQPL